MGLDMWMTVKTVSSSDGGVDEGEEVGYWRKANAVHNWIVTHCANGVDECQEIEMSLEDVLALHVACANAINDRENAHEYLPTVEGFFFGTTEYDDWYFKDASHTLKVLQDVLERFTIHNGNIKVIYQASW